MTDEAKQKPTAEEPEKAQVESEKAEKTFTQLELDEIVQSGSTTNGIKLKIMKR